MSNTAKVESLRKELAKAKAKARKNESANEEVKRIQEELKQLGCGSKRIDS